MSKKIENMNNYKNLILIFVLLFAFACENPWDEHVKVNENVLQESIGDYLSANNDFSSFVSLLESTGMNELLSSSVIYTVWAPNNAAMEAVDANLLDTDEKKKLFVQNHIAFGSFSANSDKSFLRIKMRSGKLLDYNPNEANIDGATILTELEAEAQNGTIQIIEKALTPRYSIWEHIELEATDNKFINFLNSLTTEIFYEDSSIQIGINESGKPVYDSVWIVQNAFLENVVDLSNENIRATMLIPSDEVFESEFNKYQKYYRIEDKRNNLDPSARDSVYIKLMIARDMAISGSFSNTETADTLLSFYNVKVPFIKNAITQTAKASNGYVHYLNDCSVKITDKIKPILMEAENHVYSTFMSAGTPNPYFRLRDEASNGMDFICDNAHNSQLLSGVVFAGPVTASIKYRVKIRAINDFGKSYRRQDTSVVLIQKLGTVTVSRDKITGQITTISEVTNPLNYKNTSFGTPDVNSDTIFVRKNEYSQANQAISDEIDLGFYEFNRSDNVFLRLSPLASQMAVTADYFRLVPIIEE